MRVFHFEGSSVHKLLFFLNDSKNEPYSLYDKLDNIEEELFKYGFLRTHKSYLVNTKYIKKVSNYKVEIDSGIILPIPREKFQSDLKDTI